MKGYITFDYELCLGSRTGSAEGCLIQPMHAITSMFSKYNIKSNIFVDAAYLLRLKELQNTDERIDYEYSLVTNNVIELSSQGHSIQLHFHPQWLNATFDNNAWHLDNEHYKLSDLPVDVQKVKLSQAIELLQSFSKNKIVAFRAGGFSVENFGDIASLLFEKGITIDTSVLRGGFVNSKYQTYDYRNIPLSSSYPFKDNNKVLDSTGAFREYPISVMELNSLYYTLYKKIKRKEIEKEFSCYSSRRWNDGLGIGDSVDKKTRIINLFNRVFKKSPLYASADGALVYFLNDVLNYCETTYKGDDFIIIGHPKIASPRTIAALESFILKNNGRILFNTFS